MSADMLFSRHDCQPIQDNGEKLVSGISQVVLRFPAVKEFGWTFVTPGQDSD